MGCDGGTIPKRHELVKTAKRGEQKDKDMDRDAKWTLCSISQQHLNEPIMVCELGRLYNKESILEYILDGSVVENCAHIMNMKNVKELKLTPNPGYTKNPAGCHDQYFDTQLAKYVCPVVGLEMNGKYKFCVLWSCGCVLSERALKEIDSDSCHNCGSKFEEEDVVVIYPEDDDLQVMEANIEVRKTKLKALRKEKKLKKNKRKLDNGDNNVNGPSTSSKDSSSKHVDEDGDVDVPTKSHVEDHVFEAPKKLPKMCGKLQTDKKLDKKKKLANGDTKLQTSKKGDTGSSSKSDPKQVGNSSKIDPKQTNVYKKLFTSGQEKKSSDKSPHWITYNPYHL